MPSKAAAPAIVAAEEVKATRALGAWAQPLRIQPSAPLPTPCEVVAGVAPSEAKKEPELPTAAACADDGDDAADDERPGSSPACSDASTATPSLRDLRLGSEGSYSASEGAAGEEEVGEDADDNGEGLESASQVRFVPPWRRASSGVGLGLISAPRLSSLSMEDRASSSLLASDRTCPWRRPIDASTTEDHVAETPRGGLRPWRKHQAPAADAEPFKATPRLYANSTEFVPLWRHGTRKSLTEDPASPRAGDVSTTAEPASAPAEATVLRAEAADMEEEAARPLAGETAAEPSNAPAALSPTSAAVGATREAHARPPKGLEVSENSWAARQRARRNSAPESGDGTTDVVRAAKSILNKLTIEKFTHLYDQLVSCGIRTAEHLEILITEIFEKATTQHHFIDMYADLCSRLDEHFTQNPIGGHSGTRTTFKKLLLNACQASFEQNLAAPASIQGSSEEDVKLLNKFRMLGNMRFIGSLLVRKMLAGKVLIAISEELINDPSPETLESLAALLTVVGPTFDTPAWSGHLALRGTFDQVATIVKEGKTVQRVQCLLKDVLDLRQAAWLDRRPKKIEGPSLISEVAERAQAEDGGRWA